MPRIYREHPDSSYLTAPRIFPRVFCNPGELIPTVRFYESLTHTRLDMDMDIPEAGLHVAAVGPFLILELNPEQHDLAAQTTVTVLNADLDDVVQRQVAAGAEIIQERWDGPVGAGTRLLHPTASSSNTFSTAPPRTTSTNPARRSSKRPDPCHPARPNRTAPDRTQRHSHGFPKVAPAGLTDRLLLREPADGAEATGGHHGCWWMIRAEPVAVRHRVQSWPLLLSPQQSTVSSRRTPQASLLPALTDLNLPAGGVTTPEESSPSRRWSRRPAPHRRENRQR